MKFSKAKTLLKRYRNNIMPVVGDYYLCWSTPDGRLALRCTDLSTWITVIVDGKFDLPKVMVPKDIINAQKDIKFITLEDGFISINGITSPHDPDLVSEMPNYRTLEGETKSTTLSLVKGYDKFASKDDLRPAMQGISFSPKGIAVTDAHKLIWNKTPQTFRGIVNGYDYATLASYSLSYGVEWTETFDPEDKDNDCVDFAEFYNDDIILNVRLVDSKYPDIEAVIPPNETFKAAVKITDVPQFISTLEIALTSANKATSAVNFYPRKDGSVVLFARDFDFEKAFKTVAPMKHRGDLFKFGFNGKYFLEMLKTLSGYDEIFLVCSRRAIVLFSDHRDEMMMIMPILIDSEYYENAEEEELLAAEL